MADPFLSARRRINRAKHHLQTLETESRAFWESKPYEFIADLDADGLRKTYKCRFVEPIPENLDWLVIEAIEHLRSALDQIAYASATVSGKLDSKRAYFPIADTAAKLETDVIGRGRCKDVHPDVLSVFRQFKPYQTGNQAVWALNKICNTSKHKAVTGVGMESGPSNIDLGTLPAGSVLLGGRWDNIKNEVKYFSTPANAEPTDNFNVSFFVAFGEVPVISGKPVVPLLDAMGKIVSLILAQTEITCRKLGYIE